MGDWGEKTDRVVAVALSCLAHPIPVLAASPAPGHAVVPTYEKISQTVGSDHCGGYPGNPPPPPPLGMKGGLGGMTARGGATVSLSMWSGGLMLMSTAHAQNYPEPRPEYTRCTPCPLIPFNWVKLHLMSSSLCGEEPQLEAVHLHDIWASELGWMPSAMHLSFYLTHTNG